MYDTAGPLQLDYINQRLLPRRYESDEEDISEPEMSGQDNAYSPVESYRAPGTYDSADELDACESDKEKAGFPRLLSTTYPSSGKASRPVSIDTIKRSSDTTFVADSYIFDHDDDVIIELPSPDTTSPLQSPIFLQPNVYVPESPISTRPQSIQSLSSASMYSEDETDVLVAEQVKYVEPVSKPSLILISPVSEQSPSPFKESAPTPTTARDVSHDNDSYGLYSHRRAATSQPLLWNGREGNSARQEAMKRGSMHLTTLELERLPTGSGATITSPAEVPELPPPTTLRAQSMTFPRPSTASADKYSSETRPHRPTDALRRPPSIRSLGNLSFLHGRQSSNPQPDSRSRSKSYTHSSARSVHGIPSQSSCPPSRTASPSPYYSSPSFTRERSGSTYSSSSLHSNRTPMPIRQSLKKTHTASSVYSASSLRSEVESLRSLDPRDVAEPETQQKIRRKKSLRLRQSTAIDGTEPSTVKSFMGFMFGQKRKSTIQKSNA
ncbi:hypothetical protein BDV25DRAFT_148150 [Aspergillus avenaceus]|uniref:Uncharacterized protein n=1 Tax=Aspergillus avenaceus TaxID=36643 RepID=A0A5N6U6I7_ASPAV|nr:hypothetical protein BDV25DRAFT_148150 [Aspergillus avenaceus]